MQIQYVILKVRLLSNKIPDKKIDFSLEVHKTEISQMYLLSTMRQCVYHCALFTILVSIACSHNSKATLELIVQKKRTIIQEFTGLQLNFYLVI